MAGLTIKQCSIALVAVTAAAAVMLVPRGFLSPKPSPALPGPSATEHGTEALSLVDRRDNSNASFPRAAENFADLLQRDPAQAARLAVEANASFETALAGWVHLDRRAAAVFVAGLQDAELRRRALSTVASAWLEIDAGEMVRWVSTLAQGDRIAVLGGIQKGIGRLSLQQAVALAEMVPSGAQQDWLTHLVGAWVDKDLPGLLAWAQSKKNHEREFIFRLLLPQWAQRDPAAAAQFVEAHKDLGAFDTQNSIAKAWAKVDFGAALQWVSGFSNERERQLATRAALSGLAQVEPESAAAFASTMSPGPAQDEAVETVLAEWSRRDPAKAAAWLAQFPPGTLADKGVMILSKSWAQSGDFSGAGAFLDALPPSLARDKAIGEFTQDIDGYDIEAAVRWSLKIDDATERERRFGNALARWLREDRSAAERWIAESRLETSTLQEALKHAGMTLPSP